MEGPTVNLKKISNSSCDATVELPVLQMASRNKVDVYLPNPVSNWQGPALQDSPARLSTSDDDIGMPPKGMLRPVDTTFSNRPDTELEPSAAPSIRSYARRSRKRGLYVTIAIALLLAAGGAWALLNLDALQQALLTRFK